MAYNLNYDSDYEIRLATLGELGGDTTKKYDSVYEIDLAILDAIEGGGGGGAAIDDNNVSTGTTYSSYKITQLLADAGFDVSIAQSLPASGDAHTIFFIPSSDPQTSNIYDEYLYVGNDWEQVGSTAIDLSNYATKNDISIFTPIVEITQAEYDALPTASKNDGSVYSITDAVIVDMNNYYTKAAADSLFNPKNTVAQSTSGYKFPLWNAYGLITGAASSQAYTSNLVINGATAKTLYANGSGNIAGFYAPTTAGTSGQYLVSSGSGAPTWQNLEVASDYVVSDADASAGTYSTDIAAFYAKTINENVMQGVQIKIVDTHIITPASYNVSTATYSPDIPNEGDLLAVEDGQGAEIRFTLQTRAGEQYYNITIGTDGTITDPDSTGLITVSSVSITGYNIYELNEVEGYGWFAITSGTIYKVDHTDPVTATSDSYYLPSSSRIYEGNVELWLMSTENGQTWENRHYLITNNTVSRDISTGTFGPANA